MVGNARPRHTAVYIFWRFYMKNLKQQKFGLYTFVALLTVFGFAACGGGGGGDDTPVVTVNDSTLSVTLQENLQVTLIGSATDPDGNDSELTYLWTKKSGPNAIIATPNAATTQVTGLKNAGTYVFELYSTNPEGKSGTNTVTVNVQVYEATRNVTVAAVPFTAGTTMLDLEVASDNYIFADSANSAYINDLSGITYTLSSTNPTRTTTQLAPYVLTGKLLASEYADLEFPVVTQTFYYNGQSVGSRAFSVRKIGESFATLRDEGGTNVNALPAVTLNLKKTVTELP
jgi:hypothetical protein